MAQEPTVVLVHGAWHGSWAWDAVASRLMRAGIDVVAVDLPSSGPHPAALTGLHEDAAVVRAAIDAVDGPVVVVAHSYGGAPVSEGAAGAANVAHLVYLTAFMLDAGESLLGLVGGQAPPWWIVSADGGSILVDGPQDVFFNGVSDADAAAAVAALEPQSFASTTDALRAAAWKDVPSTYVVSERDNAIPVAAQEMLAARAGAVHRLDAGHSPFLSHPDEVVAIIRGVLPRDADAEAEHEDQRRG
jgi:pimeloyl-ACP methyl ester carboxylesterase